MSLTVKIPHLHAFALKCCALIFGYTLWHTISEPYKIETMLEVPLSFYNTNTITVQAPESVRIKVYASRKQLFKAAQSAAIHYDASLLQQGTQVITLASGHIFLPESVSLLHSIPTKIKVTVAST